MIGPIAVRLSASRSSAAMDPTPSPDFSLSAPRGLSDSGNVRIQRKRFEEEKKLRTQSFHRMGPDALLAFLGDSHPCSACLTSIVLRTIIRNKQSPASTISVLDLRITHQSPRVQTLMLDGARHGQGSDTMPSSSCSMPPQLSWRLLSACRQPVSPKEELVTALSRYPRRVRDAKRVVSRHRFPLQIPSRSTPTRGGLCCPVVLHPSLSSCAGPQRMPHRTGSGRTKPGLISWGAKLEAC